MATSPLGGIASIGKTVASTRLGKTPAPNAGEGVSDTFGLSLMSLVENVQQGADDSPIIEFGQRLGRAHLEKVVLVLEGGDQGVDG